MAITRYTMTMQLEFSTAEDRDAAYAKAKTWATTEKSGGEVKRRCEGIYRRRQYVLPSATVDSIAAGGGFAQMNLAALAAAIRNGLEE